MSIKPRHDLLCSSDVTAILPAGLILLCGTHLLFNPFALLTVPMLLTQLTATLLHHQIKASFYFALLIVLSYWNAM